MLLAHVLLGRVLLAGGNAAGAEAAVERSFKLGIDPGELAPTLAEAQLLQGKHRALLTDAAGPHTLRRRRAAPPQPDPRPRPPGDGAS